MRILFGLASPIVRNNGIMAFIRGTTKVLQSMGHTVDFITDAPPSIPITSWFDNIYFTNTPTDYPIFHSPNGRPSIRFIPEIQNRIVKRYAQLDEYDLVIGNDAQTTAAFLDSARSAKVMHYVHTGALLGENRTCLTDSFVAFERELLDYCIVGAQHQNVLDVLGAKNGAILHMPLFDHEQFLPKPYEQQEGLMFIGDGTTSKGADVFEQVCADRWPAKIVAFELNDVIFERVTRKDIRRFEINDLRDKAAFIRSAKAGFHPSPCECFPFALMEMLLSKPVVLDRSYAWTHSFTELGAILVNPHETEQAIDAVMNIDYKYDNRPIIEYIKKVVPSWRKFLLTFL